MTDRPDLVAFYDIRPGNGAGLFLQPRSPYGVGLYLLYEMNRQQRQKMHYLISKVYKMCTDVRSVSGVAMLRSQDHN